MSYLLTKVAISSYTAVQVGISFLFFQILSKNFFLFMFSNIFVIYGMFVSPGINFAFSV